MTRFALGLDYDTESGHVLVLNVATGPVVASAV
jgi:ribulose kinase